MSNTFAAVSPRQFVPTTPGAHPVQHYRIVQEMDSCGAEFSSAVPATVVSPMSPGDDQSVSSMQSAQQQDVTSTAGGVVGSGPVAQPSRRVLFNNLNLPRFRGGGGRRTVQGTESSSKQLQQQQQNLSPTRRRHTLFSGGNINNVNNNQKQQQQQKQKPTRTASSTINMVSPIVDTSHPAAFWDAQFAAHGINSSSNGSGGRNIHNGR